MKDPEKLQEIENLGEEEEEWGPEESVERTTGGAVPLLQAAVCVLLLLALAFLKFTDSETYGKAVSWYQSEITKEVELPRWNGENGEASAKVSSSLSQIPAVAEPEIGALERV